MQGALRRCAPARPQAERVVFGSPRLALAVLMATIVFVATPGVIQAQFIDPQVVSGPLVGCFQPDVAYRVGDRASVSFVRAGEVFHTQSGNGFAATEPVSQSPGSATAVPQIEPGSLIVLNAVYQETFDGDSEIFLIDNNGGFFANPVALTDNSVNDRDPQIHSSPLGSLAIAWDRTTGVLTEVIAWIDGVEYVLGEGEDVSVASNSFGDVIVGYLRGGSAFTRLISNGVVAAELPLAPSISGVTSVDLDLGPDGSTRAVLVAGGDLHLAVSDTAGLFGRASLVVDGNVTGVADVAVGSGRTVIAYADSGEVFLADNGSGSFVSTLLSTGGVASDPAVTVDPHDFAHVVWSQQGQILYTNDGQVPVADFSGDVTSGVLPLTVSFTNETTGVFSTVFWDFGDGTASASVSPTHTFETPGPFTVTMTVIGPSGTDTRTRINYISGSLPEDVIRIPDISVFAGQDVLHPVLATNSDPIQGFQFACLYDADNIDFNGIALDASVTEAQSPEFIFVNDIPDGPNSELIIAIVLDFVEPFDGRTIPAGVEQLLFSFDYTVNFPLPLGTTADWRIVDSLGDPPVTNIFASQFGISLQPYPLDGETRVDSLPQTLFLRGDANYDQMIDIGDPIFLLGFFFSSGPEPVCPDSGDCNDDGVLDIGDPIFDLSFLFSGGATPPYPFPAVGLDPTPDSLPLCLP